MSIPFELLLLFQMPTAARKGELLQVQLFKREVDIGGEFAGTGVGV